MMDRNSCIAMLLAGGQGSRLGVLTGKLAKPAVPFGGKYRIIDFTLSNCVNSGIETVGILTQYQPHELSAYVGNGRPWGLDRMVGGVQILPPFVQGKFGQWYKGTANAIYQNMIFIDRFEPEYVVVLSGDHIYKMDYRDMLGFHIDKGAVCTIAAMEVPLQEASRFGIMNTKDDGRIYEFDEKPEVPKSNKASMGVYIFSWSKLKEFLQLDDATEGSSNDFGKDVLPAMLDSGEPMFAYPFAGYWKDVGTVESLWDANMDLLDPDSTLNMDDPRWKIYGRNPVQPPAFIGSSATVHDSMVTEGAVIHGELKQSVIFHSCYIGEGARVGNSVVMPGAYIGPGATVDYSIIAEGARIEAGAMIVGERDRISVIGGGRIIGPGSKVGPGEWVGEDLPGDSANCADGQPLIKSLPGTGIPELESCSICIRKNRG